MPPAPRRGPLARFVQDSRAIAAVEFALILPVMMIMYLGMVELTRAVSNSRKVTVLARTLADLTARGEVTSMSDIFGASSAVMAPFSATDARMVVSSVGVYGIAGGLTQGRICGSQASGTGATALPVNSVVTVPSGFQVAGLRFIRADVAMSYTPMLGSAILRWVTGNNSAAIDFSEQTPWPVRNGKTYNSTYQEIKMPGGQPCPVI